MKKVKSLMLFSLGAGFFLVSCNDGGKNKDTVYDQGKTIVGNVENKDKIAYTPVTRADSALLGKEVTFSQLSRFVTKDFQGGLNRAGEVHGEDGSIGKSGAKYYPFARQIYYRGSDSIRVELGDYIRDLDHYEGLLHMYGFNSEPLEDNLMKTHHYNIGVEGTRALGVEYKSGENAKLMVAFGRRYLLMLTQSGKSDMNLLLGIAREIDYDKVMAEGSAAKR